MLVEAEGMQKYGPLSSELEMVQDQDNSSCYGM